MNALTQIRNTQKATKAEIELGISDKSSWHARFKHSAYVFAGGLPFELTEGDLLAVFSQYGEIVDLHLVRDKKTGKSRGFAFLAYEDQRSTVLAVDNLSGARVAGRTVRVEHVDNYKRKRAEMEGEPIPEESDEEAELDNQQRERAAAEAGGATVVDAREAGGREPDASGGAAEDAPWGGGSSLFDLMAQAKAEGLMNRPWKESAGGKAKEKEHHRGRDKEKKEKKHKKEKKEKMRRSRSRSPGRKEEERRSNQDYRRNHDRRQKASRSRSRSPRRDRDHRDRGKRQRSRSMSRQERDQRG